MSYVAVSPGLGAIDPLSIPQRSIPLTPSPSAARDAALAKAKALAKVKLEAQARGKKDAAQTPEVPFNPKVLTQFGVDAQKAGVSPEEVAETIESSYKVGWASVKPLPAVAAQPPPPDTSLPVGEPQPLASIFVKKLTELIAKGVIEEQPKLRELLPMTEEQLRALVATVESRGAKGAAEVRAAFEQSIAELAAMKADESKKKVMVAGAVAVAAVAAFLFMRRKKS
jgi:hypothetical protein